MGSSELSNQEPAGSAVPEPGDEAEPSGGSALPKPESTGSALPISESTGSEMPEPGQEPESTGYVMPESESTDSALPEDSTDSDGNQEDSNEPEILNPDQTGSALTKFGSSASQKYGSALSGSAGMNSGLAGSSALRQLYPQSGITRAESGSGSGEDRILFSGSIGGTKLPEEDEIENAISELVSHFESVFLLRYLNLRNILQSFSKF